MKMSYGRRRRPSYRRFNKRSIGQRRNAVMSTNGLRGGGLAFKSRKISRRAWKKKLWDNTLATDHYRSIQTTLTTSTTPGTRTDARWFTIRCFPSNFYVSPGGAYPPVSGTSDFTRSVTIRGGKVTLLCYNASPVSLRLRLFLMRTILGGTLPGTTVVKFDYDPTIESGNRKDFKIYKDWTFIVGPTESVNVEHRLGISEYDTSIGPNQYVWNWGIVHSNLTTNAPVTIDFYHGHNMSFSGDLSIE